MHFLSYLPPTFTKMFWVHFHDFCVQKQTCLPWSPDAFWRFSVCKLKIKLWEQFLNFCVQKRRFFLWISDAFFKFSACKFYRKSSGRNFTSCASKTETVCCGVQTHFASSPLANLTEKALGTISRILRPKTKLFAVKFRRISKVLCLQGLQKKLWAQFHDLCVQWGSCFPWSLYAFWNFLLSSFIKKVLGAFPDLCVQKWSCLLWSSDAFWKFSACKLCKKSCCCNSTLYAF